METAKATRWAFTAYEQQWELFKAMPPIVAEWGWQEEVCPDTQRHHYQGFLRTDRQVRLSQLKKALPGVHLEIARNWDALKSYCKKEETAVDGTQRHETVSKSLTMAQALRRVAEVRPPSDNSRLELIEDFRQAYIREYELAVATLLREDPNLIGLYSQPQYERAYVKWRNVWVELAESEKTDRQTDKTPDEEDALAAFLDDGALRQKYLRSDS